MPAFSSILLHEALLLKLGEYKAKCIQDKQKPSRTSYRKKLIVLSQSVSF